MAPESYQASTHHRLKIEISPEPSQTERAVIEAAVQRHLENSKEAKKTLRSLYGATRLRDFER